MALTQWQGKYLLEEEIEIFQAKRICFCCELMYSWISYFEITTIMLLH